MCCFDTCINCEMFESGKNLYLICHFIVVKAFKICFSTFSEKYSISSLSTLTLLCNRTVFSYLTVTCTHWSTFAQSPLTPSFPCLCICLISLYTMTSSSIHVVTNGRILSFYVYVYHVFFIHSSLVRHLGLFLCLVIVNSAAFIIGICVFNILISFPMNTYQ
jgi:hypothetical protein